jgi:predicted RecA/RadA family phage recombinase
MADYTPVAFPGSAIGHLRASATIVGGNVVAVSGVNTVAPAGANAQNVVGVAVSDALNGETVTYMTEGIHELVNTVAPAGANAQNVVGVAVSDALNGETVTYMTEGIHELVTTGTVTAGDIVVAAAAGTVSTLAAVTTPTPADVTNTRAIIGIALTTATTGLKVNVQVRL